jgi:hypothetical protein
VPLPSVPFPLPDAPVLDADGNATSTRALVAGKRALLIFGHQNCKTTRQTLPYVDRIHRAGGRAFAVLQDPVGAAAEALRKLDATIPFVSEADPYPFAQAISAEIVPTLLLVEEDGTVSATSEAFSRAALESFAAKLGVASPVLPGDTMPATKPG